MMSRTHPRKPLGAERSARSEPPARPARAASAARSIPATPEADPTQTAPYSLDPPEGHCHAFPPLQGKARKHDGSRRGRVDAPAGGDRRGREARARREVARSAVARRLAFLGVAGVTVAAVGALLWPRGGPQSDVPVAATIQVSMAGFSMPNVKAVAGQPLRLRLVNPDSQFHTDGGGWHQLAIPQLGVDVRVPPKGTSLVDVPAAAPGEYVFYCDICCGGKENPMMQGVLQVTA
jgi:cytochrome c oxidase subunit II